MRDRPGMNHTGILLLVSLAQMLVSSLLLTCLIIENWSAVFAEDSEGYILAGRFFSGHDIPPASLTLLKYRLFSPLLPFLAAQLGRIIPLEYATARRPSIGPLRDRNVRAHGTAHSGKVRAGDTFIHESIIGSLFRGRVEARASVGTREANIPSVEGWAVITGFNTIFINDDDPFRHGFQVL